MWSAHSWITVEKPMWPAIHFSEMRCVCNVSDQKGLVESAPEDLGGRWSCCTLTLAHDDIPGPQSGSLWRAGATLPVSCCLSAQSARWPGVSPAGLCVDSSLPGLQGGLFGTGGKRSASCAELLPVVLWCWVWVVGGNPDGLIFAVFLLQNGFDYLLTYSDNPQTVFPRYCVSWMVSSGE